MYSLEEFKKLSSKKKENQVYGPSKDDVLYQKYLESKPEKTWKDEIAERLTPKGITKNSGMVGPAGGLMTERKIEIPTASMSARRQTTTPLPEFNTTADRNAYRDNLQKQADDYQKDINKYLAGWRANSVVTDPALTEINKKLSDARKQLEQINKLEQAEAYGQKYLDGQYDDNFIGQAKANYAVGRMGQDSSLAWNAYLNNPTEANRKYAERIDEVMQKFREANAETLADDATLPWLSQSFAQYVPQLIDQTKAGAAGALGGAVVGGTVAPVVGAVGGARAGYTAGVGMQSYDLMRGAAFKSLIDAGVDEETALRAANDEALISSLVEMGDAAVDIMTLGGLSALKGGIAGAFKIAAGTSAKKKAMLALANYGINIGSEGLEEAVQEAVSIGNARRIADGDMSLNGLVGHSFGVAEDAITGRDMEAGGSILDAAKEGAKISAVMAGADAVVSRTGEAYRKYLDAKYSKAETSENASGTQNALENTTTEQANRTTPQNPVTVHETAISEGLSNSPAEMITQLTDAQTKQAKDRDNYLERYYHENGANILRTEAEKRGSLKDAEDILRPYYTAGVMGMSFDEVEQTAFTSLADPVAARDMYQAGVNDRTADMTARLQGQAKLSRQTPGVLLKTDAVTEKQKALSNLVAKLGKVEVEIVGTLPSRANGEYQNGRIYVALDAESFSGALFHETVHYIAQANAKGYDRMAQTVMRMAAEVKGMSVDAYVRAYEDMYADAIEKNGYDAIAVREELIADAFQMLAADEARCRSLIAELKQSDPTILEQIKEFLQKMLETLEGLVKDGRFHAFAEDINKDIENTKKLQKIFAEELREAGRTAETKKQSAEQTGSKKFSLIGWTKDGTEVYETSDETKGLTWAQRKQKALNMLENEYKGRVAKFWVGNNAYYAMFEKGDLNKNLYGDNKSDAKGRDAKVNAIADGDMFELVENAKYRKSKAETGKNNKNHKGVLSWDYFAKTVQIDNVVFDVVINVRKKTDGEFVYNIQLNENKNKTAEPPQKRAYSRRSEMATPKNGVHSAVGNSVAQKGKDGNRKFSLRDSNGRSLSAGQREYFKDSKAMDENGRLLVMYHGTRKGEFEAFRDWTYLTANRDYAERYTDKDTGKTMYEVYANIKKPFDTRLPEVRAIFEDEFMGVYGGTPLQESGLPDWTDGYDLAEFIEENGYDFDAILLDEGADPDGKGGVIERGVSYVIRSSEQAKDVKNLNPTSDKRLKFSMKEPVEETKNLIAVHNLYESNLKKVLDIGGFAMPSIAIIRDNMDHSKYGEISVVFGKETIDPKNKKNQVYGGDAWTPTIPGVNYEVNLKKEREFEREIWNLSSQILNGMFAQSSILSGLGIEEWTDNSQEQIANRLADRDAVMAAYAADKGIAVELAYQKKKYDQYGNEFLQKIIDHFGYQKLAEMSATRALGEELREEDVAQIREIWKQDWWDRMPQSWKRKKTPEELEKMAEVKANMTVDTYRAGLFAEHAWQMYEEGGGHTDEIDRWGTQHNLNNAVKHDDVANWVMPKLDGLLGNAGIYNGKDRYTPSGNRRSFKQLHHPYTLENLVKAMKANQKDRGEGLWGATASGLQSVTVSRYGSIADIKADSGRLQMMDDEEYQGKLAEIDDKISEIIREVMATNKAYSDNSFWEMDSIGEILIQAAQKGSANAVKTHFSREGYTITDKLAKEIYGMAREAASLPTGYFEAKPQRAVGFDEVRAVVVPNNIDQATRERLEDNGMNVVEYAAGDEESRKEALNSIPDVKFSVRESGEAELRRENASLISENKHLQKLNDNLKKQFKLTDGTTPDPKSVRRVAKAWLKQIESKADLDDFTMKLGKITEYFAKAENKNDREHAMAALRVLVRDAMEQAETLNTEMRDEYSGLIKQIRNASLKVTDELRSELENYGGYNTIRRENFSRMNLSTKGKTSIDSFYYDLCQEYPEFFREEDAADEAEQLMNIIAVLDTLKPVAENPYGYSLDEYVYDETMGLLDKMAEISMDQTFADKKKADKVAALKNAKAEFQTSIKVMREEVKAAQDDAEKAYLAGRMVEGRRKAKEIAELEAKHQRLKERTKKYRDNRELKRVKETVLRDSKKMLEWLNKGTDKNHVPENMRNAVEKILTSITTKDARINQLQLIALKDAYGKHNPENESSDYLEYDPDVNAILEKFTEQDKYKDGIVVLDGLTLEEMQNLSKMIRSLKHTIQKANKWMSLKRELTMAEACDSQIFEWDNVKDATQYGAIRQLHKYFGMSMADANVFFKEFGKVAHETVWRGLRTAFDKKINFLAEAEEFSKGIDQKQVAKWRAMPPQKFELPSGDIWLTPTQVMSLYCLAKREDAKRHLYGGGMKAAAFKFMWKLGAKFPKEAMKQYAGRRVTEADVNAITATLTDEQKATADKIQKFLVEHCAKWGNETSMLMFGYMKFGDPNYFPIRVDGDTLTSSVGDPQLRIKSIQNTGAAMPIDERAKNALVLEDIFSVLASHVEEMSSYAAFVPALSDLNKFVNYKVRDENGEIIFSMKTAIGQKVSPDAMGYIYDLLETLNGSPRAAKEGILPKTLVRNAKTASVAANLRVIAQQPTAYLRAGIVMDVKYLLQGMTPGKVDREEVFKYCPIARWKAMGNYDMNIGKTVEQLVTGQTMYQKIIDKSMAGAGWADSVTWGWIWKACKAETADKYPELKGEEFLIKAGERMSEVIDDTQVVDSPLHRSQMMRNKSLYMQMITSYMSEPTKAVGLVASSVIECRKNPTKENKKKVMRTWRYLIATGVLTAAFAGVADMFRDDDEDEEMWEKFLQAFWGDQINAETPKDRAVALLGSNIGDNLNPLNSLPLMRDVLSMLQGYEITRSDFAWMADIMNNISKWNKYLSGESEYTLTALLGNTAQSLSKVTGMPIKSVARELDSVRRAVVGHMSGDVQYKNAKITYSIGSEKNISRYVSMMLEARMNGDKALATKIYNEMIRAGIDNEKIDNKIDSVSKKKLESEPEVAAGAEAYREGDYDALTGAIDSLNKKGYSEKNAADAITKAYNKKYGEEEDEELTYDEITESYWNEDLEESPADYQMMENAFVSGNMDDYNEMWSILKMDKYKEANMKTTMKKRLKKIYHEQGTSPADKARIEKEYTRLDGRLKALRTK